MSGKQITGVILLLVGLGMTFIGGANVLDLINVGDNELVRLGLELQGTSLTSLWIKFGTITLIGIVMLVLGITFAKKQPVTINQ